MKKILYICSFLLSITVFSQRTVTKDVGDFNTIKVFDLIEVNLIKSDRNSVNIKGENVDDIQIVNKNGTLKLRMKLDRKFHGEDTYIEVFYTDLDVIDGNEGARITSNELIKQNRLEIKTQEGARVKVGLDVDYLKIRSVTGGIIKASGLAKNQEVVLNTGGVFEGRKLQTETSKVKITAAGEADVFATEQVDINVKAGGDVYVYGNPKQVNKKTFVGGRVYMKD